MNINAKGIVHTTLIVLCVLAAPLAMSSPAHAACGATDKLQFRRSIVTYYDARFNTLPPSETRGTRVVDTNGQAYYRIRLRGVLYFPCAALYSKTAKFPAFIVNHGSGAEFEADTKHWQVANYFVPKGYIVFVPFRRGQGDHDAPAPNHPTLISDKSTGVYIEDLLTDWGSGSPVYFHDTQCPDKSCYRAQLLEEQADEEVVSAIGYLQGRADVKQDPVDPEQPNVPPLHRLGIMGLSYGGAVTVFANRNGVGQRAAVAVSPGAQQWDAGEDCLVGDPDCGTAFQRKIIAAAAGATTPAYYLQAKWDYDTRATIDLAYAHAYYSPVWKHHRAYMASIFDYTYPCATPDPDSCTDDDYQSIHTGFFADPAVWGPSVLNFLRRNNVK